jgi:hypothetical protein
LSERNTVTIQAAWRGDVYTEYLRLRKVFDGKEGPPGDQGKQGDPSPRYRGKTSSPGSPLGVVTIQGVSVQMYAGDWVAYVGTTNGIWVNGMCMRWTGVSWEAIPISADGDFDTNPYVAALMDLTEGAGNGTFMSILVRDLIAKTSMIEYIASHKLHIQTKDGSAGAVYGGGYDENGNAAGGPGFYLGTDGVLKADNLEANRGTFKYGTFDGITIKGNSTFSGSITSGPLVVSDENSGGGTVTYPKDTTASYLYNRDNIADGINVSGNYNGKAMARISGSIEPGLPGLPGHSSRNCYINIVYQDGTSEVAAHTHMSYFLTVLQSTTEVKRLLYPLTFTFVNGGKTVKLIGLPSNRTPAGSGKIYTMTDGDGTHLMIN